MSSMAQFAYDLPFYLLEGVPREIRLGRRDLGRMLIADRATGSVSDSYVRDLPSWFRAGDVLVLNNSKRIPGVLDARTKLGGKVELRFVELDDDDRQAGLCRIFPDHDVEAGDELRCGDGTVIEVVETGLTKYELARVRTVGPPLRQALKEVGRPIAGFFYDGHWGVDNLNPYYASEEGSVESPLAGLHFTEELVERISATGATVAFVTLHSVGSWLPFLEDTAEDHVMWAEQFRVPQETADAVNEAHRAGGRVVAVGSTSMRSLESATGPDRVTHATHARTSLYVTPGYDFRAVDAYFTNFHQQQTSMIVLDAAFAGTELAAAAYRHAVAANYGFFEFGDAVFMT
jgi:S-adenosylmethionine:tRNA ribosyltransferase-isomerase